MASGMEGNWAGTGPRPVVTVPRATRIERMPSGRTTCSRAAAGRALPRCARRVREAVGIDRFGEQGESLPLPRRGSEPEVVHARVGDGLAHLDRVKRRAVQVHGDPAGQPVAFLVGEQEEGAQARCRGAWRPRRPARRASRPTRRDRGRPASGAPGRRPGRGSRGSSGRPWAAARATARGRETARAMASSSVSASMSMAVSITCLPRASCLPAPRRRRSPWTRTRARNTAGSWSR